MSRAPAGRREPGGRRGAQPAPAPGLWLVVLPAWGARCVRVCAGATLPALAVALEALGKSVHVLLYTDSQELVECAKAWLPAAQVELCPVPGADRSFGSLSACHRSAMARAVRGERVLLLTSDMVVSREILATCEAQVASGKQAVACVSMRATESSGVPLGVSGPELLSWAWDNRHRMTRECTWPDGKSYDVWRMYFEHNGEVAARVFLPHPLVVVPAGIAVQFSPTIDVNLLGCFSPSVTHMITRPDEGAVIELSPADKEFVVTVPMHERMVTRGPSAPPFVLQTNTRHRMFFGKKVVIRGAGGDCGDGEVLGRMMLG